VKVTEFPSPQVREVNIERRVRDVEELETGIAVNLRFWLAESGDRPGVIAWSNPIRVSIQSFRASYFFAVLLENSEHR
jgi:hypothetical protein